MNTNTESKIFQTMFQKELTNRATARYAIAAIRARRLRHAERQFWSSYARLESVTEARYTIAAKALDLKPAVFTAWLQGRCAALYYRLAPARMINTMAGATDRYNRTLLRVAPHVGDPHKPLYAYLLAQEAAQVEAFALAASGDYAGASEHLLRFIKSHQ